MHNTTEYVFVDALQSRVTLSLHEIMNHGDPVVTSTQLMHVRGVEAVSFDSNKCMIILTLSDETSWSDVADEVEAELSRVFDRPIDMIDPHTIAH